MGLNFIKKGPMPNFSQYSSIPIFQHSNKLMFNGLRNPHLPVGSYHISLFELSPKISEKNDIPDGALDRGGIRRQPSYDLTGTRRHIL